MAPGQIEGTPRSERKILFGILSEVAVWYLDNGSRHSRGLSPDIRPATKDDIRQNAPGPLPLRIGSPAFTHLSTQKITKPRQTFQLKADVTMTWSKICKLAAVKFSFLLAILWTLLQGSHLQWSSCDSQSHLVSWTCYSCMCLDTVKVFSRDILAIRTPCYLLFALFFPFSSLRSLFSPRFLRMRKSERGIETMAAVPSQRQRLASGSA